MDLREPPQFSSTDLQDGSSVELQQSPDVTQDHSRAPPPHQPPYLPLLQLRLLLAALLAAGLQPGEAELPQQEAGAAQQVAGEAQIPAGLGGQVGAIGRQLRTGNRRSGQLTLRAREGRDRDGSNGRQPNVQRRASVNPRNLINNASKLMTNVNARLESPVTSPHVERV